MMKKVFSLIAMVVISTNLLFAQSVDQGRKFLYYDRTKSAKETFDKMIAANPNNIEAVYWLGQTYLKDKDSAAAKDLYQKTLATNGNAPLLLVGMGQIELMEGKTDDARQRFETAINLTKGRNIDVFNAIGEANVSAKPGDARYAIEKLNQATQVKRFNDPNTYLIMGDAYRKLMEGGNAVQAYQKALAIDPKLAAAKFKIGKIYETQGNTEFFLPAYEEATVMDPAYTPAYYDLFYYWYSRDVNKAAEYLDKYIANTDQGPEVEYLQTYFTYAKADFAGARTKAQSLVQQYGEKVNPRMFRLIAYTSDTLGDLNAAKEAMNTFLKKAPVEDHLPADYIELANINSKLPEGQEEAFANFQQAIAMDTAVANKVKYTQQAAALAKKQGNRNQEAVFLGKAYQLDPNPSQTDLYNWGMAHYQATNYKTADSIFCNVYQTKYPEEIYGYLWCARTKQAQDTAMTQGLAVDAYKLLAEKAAVLDSGKYKSQAVASYFYLVQYYNDIKKDRETAIEYLDKVLEVDPTNADATRIKDLLSKVGKQQATKPKNSGGPSAKKESSDE